MVPIERFKFDKSGWLLFIFLLVIMVSGLLSEFYQSPQNNLDQGTTFSNPLPKDLLSSASTIQLKNRLGTFEFFKQNESENHSEWIMKYPRRLPANESTIRKIFKSLNGLKIRNILPQDSINLSNFSLDKPLLRITLNDKANNNLILKLGLVNSIDNSTYISIDKNDFIYQINTLEFPLENFDLTDFIDSKIFSVSLKDIELIKIHRLQTGQRKLLLSLKKNEAHWVDNKNSIFSNDRIQKLLETLTSIKGQIILDKRSDNLQKVIDRYLRNPLFSLEIISKNNSLNTYLVSDLISDIPELRMEKNQGALILASDKEHPYIIGKDYFTFLGLIENYFKEKI